VAELPHERVYVRLGLSDTHGIGVFAIRDIAEGTNLFGNDTVELVWVERAALRDLTPAERALYHDFGIARGDRIGCPVNFHNLTPGWYLNEPAAGQAPNVRVDADLSFFAARDIAEGEELSVRYTDFSDPPR
jgi:SET domain-containing protein